MSTEDTIEAKNLKIHINEKNQGNIHINFDGEMTIYSVEKIKNILLDKLTEAKSLEADLSGVSRIDTSVFQLFLKTKMEAEENNRSFKIINPSKETKRIFTLYGESL